MIFRQYFLRCLSLGKRPSPVSFEEVRRLQDEGAVVLDAREPADFAAGHLRGSINVGLSGRFAEYAGSVVRPGTPIVLVTPPGAEGEARVRLARIGFDAVAGFLEHPHDAFAAHPEDVARSSRLTAEQLLERLRGDDPSTVLDVRTPGEVKVGLMPEAHHVQLSVLRRRLDRLDPTRPTVVYCESGYRSMIAASLLEWAGFADVSDLLGGYVAWKAYRHLARAS